jgi:RHS repeat-associated protein
MGAGTVHAQQTGAFSRHYLVELNEAAAVDDAGDVASEIARTYGGRLEVYASLGFHGFAIATTAEQARLIANDPRVRSVSENGTATAVITPPPPVQVGEQAAARRPGDAVTTGTPLGPIQIGPFKYDAAGNIIHMGGDRFTYDRMNRVTTGTAYTAQNSTTQSFTYDGFGNLKIIDTPFQSKLYIDVDPSNNKLKPNPGTESGSYVAHTWAGGSNGGYDAAGNQTSVNGGAYVYGFDSLSALSRLSGPRTEMYLYDGNEERVATVSYTNATNMTWRYTIHDANGSVLREIKDTVTNGAHAWKTEKDYVYRSGALLATVTPLSGGGDTRAHFHLDHLGSPVLITDDNGERLAVHKYWPFGADAPGSDADGERMKFTGQERDLAGSDINALDYMHARYYRSIAGRFMSMDPVAPRFDRTQSWNPYAYAMNNPVRSTDPKGKYVIDCIPGSKDCEKDKINFEEARKRALTSSDPQVRRAAWAYGKPGEDNGVNVHIAPTKDPKADGETGVGVGFEFGEQTVTTFKAEVTIKPGLTGLALESAVAHEGSHVFDGLIFWSTLSAPPMCWDLSKNLTKFDTEMNAYKVSAAVYARAGQTWKPCANCKIGAGVSPHDTELAIKNILADQSGLYKVTPQNPGARQINEAPYNDAPEKMH